LQALHSIARILPPFPAITSGLGYFDDPLPAILCAAQPRLHSWWIISRSALIPFDFLFMGAPIIITQNYLNARYLHQVLFNIYFYGYLLYRDWQIFLGR
jgi:hypothetical protein